MDNNFGKPRIFYKWNDKILVEVEPDYKKNYLLTGDKYKVFRKND